MRFNLVLPRVQAPTKRKDITPVAQEPDFLENEDEPEVTLPEGYDEMDFDDRKKAEQANESEEIPIQLKRSLVP